MMIITEQDAEFLTARKKLKPLIHPSQQLKEETHVVAVIVRYTGEMELLVLKSEEIPQVIHRVNSTFWGLFTLDKTFYP